jgi:hypothetical protein
VTEAWFKEVRFYRVVVCEEEKPLAVGIEPSDRVDIAWERTKVAEGPPASPIGELGEHAIRFVEKNVAVLGSIHAWQLKGDPKKNPPNISGDRKT